MKSVFLKHIFFYFLYISVLFPSQAAYAQDSETGAQGLIERGHKEVEFLFAWDDKNVYRVRSDARHDNRTSLRVAIVHPKSIDASQNFLHLQAVNQFTSVIEPAELQNFIAHILPGLRDFDPVRVELLHYVSGERLPNNPLRYANEFEAPIIKADFLLTGGLNGEQTWISGRHTWDWLETDERNSLREARELRTQLAQRSEALAKKGEIEKNWVRFERQLEFNRKTLLSKEAAKKQELEDKNLIYFSPDFWFQFGNHSLMRSLFEGTQAFYASKHFQMMALRFAKLESERCSVNGVRQLPFEMPTIEVIRNGIGETTDIRLDVAQKESFMVDALWHPVLTTFQQSLFNSKKLSEDLDRIPDIWAEHVKPDPLNLPSFDLDWITKAEADMERWFDLIDCSGLAMGQFRAHLSLVLQGKSMVAAESIVVSDKSDKRSDPSNLKKRSGFDSVFSSCMNYYAYNGVRKDWCRCLDFGLKRDYLMESQDRDRHEKYADFSDSFRSLLAIGNIEPLGKTKHPLWPVYQTLSMCERKVL